MQKYNPHKPKKLKKQKYPAQRVKFVPVVPERPSILNKKVDSDAIVNKIDKWCDEAKNKK